MGGWKGGGVEDWNTGALEGFGILGGKESHIELGWDGEVERLRGRRVWGGGGARSHHNISIR